MGLELKLFSGMVWSSHCSVGWSGVHIVQCGDLELSLFSGGGLEFTLFSGMVWSSHCSVGGGGVDMVQGG